MSEEEQRQQRIKERENHVRCYLAKILVGLDRLEGYLPDESEDEGKWAMEELEALKSNAIHALSAHCGASYMIPSFK